MFTLPYCPWCGNFVCALTACELGLRNDKINDDPAKAIEVPAGGKLLPTLASRHLLASACGGGGTFPVSLPSLMVVASILATEEDTLLGVR